MEQLELPFKSSIEREVDRLIEMQMRLRGEEEPTIPRKTLIGYLKANPNLKFILEPAPCYYFQLVGRGEDGL